MRLDPRPEFHRVMIHQRDRELIARSTGGQRSSRAPSLAGANGLVCLPSKNEAPESLVAKGTIMDAILIGEVYMT